MKNTHVTATRAVITAIMIGFTMKLGSGRSEGAEEVPEQEDGSEDKAHDPTRTEETESRRGRFPVEKPHREGDERHAEPAARQD